jgi:TetR/AcrR family transcriptional regulator, fatty acid metabolism regulator protein
MAFAAGLKIDEQYSFMKKEAIKKKRHSRLPREQRMREIMQVAAQVFREKGYSEALTAQIAARAGVVEGTIYRYFPGKRELLIRVVEQWYERILADYDQQLAVLQGTRARLRFMIWRHLTVIHNEPGMCRLIFNQLRAWPEYRRTSVFDLTREYTRRTLEILQQAIDAGEFRADLPLRVVRDMIYGGVEHHTWVYLRGEGDFSPDAAADAMTEMVYRGLARDEPAAMPPPAAELTLRRLEAVARRLEQSASGDGGSARV